MVEYTMNIFKLLNYLFTKKESGWILELKDEEIQPFVIQKWLMMCDSIRVQTRWLDKYVFVLKPKEYISLAWSILPKTIKQPYIKYIKKDVKEETYEFILLKIRKHFQLSDNDYNANKDRLIKLIEKDLVNWFSYYGVEKKHWNQFKLNYKDIKKYGVKKQVMPQKGLSAWGLG